jgi:cobalamin biosynthesis Mg chelatase CobN
MQTIVRRSHRRNTMLQTMKKGISVLLTIVLCFSLAMGVRAETQEGSGYTIVLQSTTEEDKTVSAQAELEEDGTTVSAFFDEITADTYTILVYYLNAEAGNNSLCTTTQWVSQAAQGETDAIKVEYSLETEQINVMVTVINAPETEESTEETAQPTEGTEGAPETESTAGEESQPTQVSTPEETEAAADASQEKTASSGGAILWIVVGVVIVAAVAGCLVYRKKKHGSD